MNQIDVWKNKLAELAVFGANIQPGQLVAITSYIGKEDVTRRIARAAYERVRSTLTSSTSTSG